MKNIHTKFKWLAMDADKCWYVYISKPILHDSVWYMPNHPHINTLQQVENLPPAHDWKTSLREIDHF